jgi:hypothetical protein
MKTKEDYQGFIKVRMVLYIILRYGHLLIKCLLGLTFKSEQTRQGLGILIILSTQEDFQVSIYFVDLIQCQQLVKT